MTVQQEVLMLRSQVKKLRWLMDRPAKPTQLALKVMDNEWNRLRESSSRGLRNYRKQKEGQQRASGPEERSLTKRGTFNESLTE